MGVARSGLWAPELLQLRVFESKTVSVIVISFRVLSQKTMLTGTNFLKELVPLRAKN